MQSRRQRLKVLHVIPSIAPCRGGPSKAIIEMVSSLRSNGIDAEITTTNDNGRDELDVELNARIDYLGVPVRFFKRFSPPINAIREFAYSRGFTAWLSRNINNYDVVHIHAVFSYCSSYAMYLARRKRIPYVVRPIGQLQHWSLAQSKTKKEWYLRIIERANLEAASAVQFTAENEQFESCQHIELNGTVIPLGINSPESAKAPKSKTRRQWQINDADFVVLYLSRLHEKKGLELLMQAMAAIEAPDLKLLVAGDGSPSYRTKLNALSKSLNLDKRCTFLGHVEGTDKNDLLHYCDLYALTSYSENFGISVLEAMAHGLTPLVSEGVALSTIIKQHQLGLVCTTNVSSIEAQLRYAITNREKIQALGRQAQHYSDTHHSWSRIAEQLRSLYLSLA